MVTDEKKSEPSAKRIYRVRSGQAFWEELTGNPEFYIQLITLMKDYPAAHRISFEKEWAKAVNRFDKDFLNEFSQGDGGIDWEKFVRFNSGTAAHPRVRKKKQ